MPPRTPRSRERGDRQLATFGLLPEPEGRNKSFTISLIINSAVIALVLIMSIFFVHHQVVEKKLVADNLLLPVTQVKPIRPVVKVKVPIVPPTPDLLNRIAPKFTYKPAPAEMQPKMARVHMNNMTAPVLPPYRPDSVALPPQPKVGTFQANIPTAVANNMGKTSTKTGGFGDPMGVHANPNANRPGTIAAVGSFSSAVGDSSGSGAARKGKVGGTDFGSGYAHGVPGGGGHGNGKVASVGFSNGVAGGTGNGPRGKAVTGGFQNNVAAAGTPKLAIANTGNETTVQVLSHPTPEYTAEAKQLRIQGDVVLEVRFSADGRVHVIRVVRGLGHGLDEQAIRVAEATHFKPATRGGKPVDTTTYYRIDFQLA
ncbi:MAG: energy transducer TonB [Acidobacteriaceae bacterium]